MPTNLSAPNGMLSVCVRRGAATSRRWKGASFVRVQRRAAFQAAAVPLLSRSLCDFRSDEDSRGCCGLEDRAPTHTHNLWVHRVPGLIVLSVVLTTLGAAEPTEQKTLRLEVTWGHRSVEVRPFLVKLSGQDLTISDRRLEQGEDDTLQEGVVRSRAGAGDVDGLSCTLSFAPLSIKPITNAHQIWKYLLDHGDPKAAERLRADPAYRRDSRKLTVQLDESGLRGFSLSVDQLLTHQAFWLPEFDLFVSAGDRPPTFAAHQKALELRRGQRVLDRVAREPEASCDEYVARWEDMGNPVYRNPRSVPPGHIVDLTWDSALYKFGIDRLAGAWNDYGKLDRFHLALDFGDAQAVLAKAWKGQRLTDGLPVITTTFEKGGVRCEVEQFAFPLEGPPAERRGDIKMVLLQKARLTELEGKARTVPIRLVYERELPTGMRGPAVKFQPKIASLEDSAQRTLLVVEGTELSPQPKEAPLSEADVVDGKKVRTCTNRLELTLNLPARSMQEFTVKLPSPAVADSDRAKLLALDYAVSRAATLSFWNGYLARGAQFRVPEEAVNTLFRANLWHALRLPRRHGGRGPEVKIDLPYSNFAYGQSGTPWPVNQAVYVDYMLYDLRGHHSVSAEELSVMYRNNQEPNGHVGGFANWGVYTPGMLYSVAQHFLLSGDRTSFEQLLPQTLRALDWCLAEMERAKREGSPAPGLVLAPLNDLSHEPRSWAFNQAYLVAGVDLLGRALADILHPRAAECRAAAQSLRAAVEREFARAAVRSPAVQLADGTWSPYVPCDAQASGRLLSVWYPTDVDTGALHLSRLRALDPHGALTTALLHDHEDNLFLNQWGMANEPVYNQHATAYLLRDEPKAAIRSFYSMMACAFSHSVFEPVEHRWSWGQYFGPPSTDGAWFELYRGLLIQERDDDTLLLCQATPRAWLESGKRIDVQRAPTYYGPLSFTLESRVTAGEITATINLAERKRPAALLVRFRHPDTKPMRSVSVNGQSWTDFEPEKEWVRIPRPTQSRYVIISHH